MIHTAYLVAHAYTDPAGRMSPQIHAVRIYSESALSLSYIGTNSVALDVYHYGSGSYQEASDRLCHLVQTMPQFAWCRPLMDPRHMEAIDGLCVEMIHDNDTTQATVRTILQHVLRIGDADARNLLPHLNQAGILVRDSTVEEMNAMLRRALASGRSCGYVRFWLKRDYDKYLDNMKQHEAEYNAHEKTKSATYVNALTNLTDATFGSNPTPTDSITSASL